MGMFSWVCKGCKEELAEGEYVRLDGRKQEYNGYGGSAAADGLYDPVAWHVLCYNKASVDQKLDETPSRPAPNQGFGRAKLKFREHYEENAPTKYYVTIHCREFDDPPKKWDFYLTENGLEDRVEHTKLMDEAYERINKERTAAWWKEFIYQSSEAQDAFYEEQRQKAIQRIGRTSPELRKLEFESIQECLEAVKPLFHLLPTNGELTIFGKQEKAHGAVYEEEIIRA
jgi:hypothetical protein